MLSFEVFLLWVIDWEIQVDSFCDGFVKWVVVEMGIGERVLRDFKDEDGGGMEGFVFRGEESGGVGSFCGGHEMCEVFENGHLMH